MAMWRVIGISILLSGPALSAQVQNKYQISEAERAACEDDAVKLCSAAYPDQDALLACMRTNVASLTQTCRSTFVAGLHKRGLD